MKKLALLLPSLLITLLFASNPPIFSTLGDRIYDNASKIEKLKKFKVYAPFKEKIERYLHDVNTTKQLGFSLENATHEKSARLYLKKLRELAKTNDFFVRSANAVCKKALITKDYELLMDILDTGLVDIKHNKAVLLKFYAANKDAFTPRGVLRKIVQEDASKKSVPSERDAKTKHEEENIRNLREKDRIYQEKLQNKLEKDIKPKS